MAMPKCQHVVVGCLIGLSPMLASGMGCGTQAVPPNAYIANVDVSAESSSFVIGGSRVSTRLGTGGRFELRKSVPTRNVLDIELFTQTPTDSPCTGEMILEASDINISVQSSASSASVTVRVMIDRAGASSPCSSGTEVGTFRINMSNGSVRVSTGRLQLTGGALRDVLSNGFSLCLEAEANFDGSLTITQLVYSFSASDCSGDPGDDDDEDDCQLSPVCEDLQNQYSDVADEWMQVYYSGSQQFSNDLTCRYYSLWVQINDLDCFCEDEDDEDLAYLDGLLALGLEQMRDYVDSACRPPCPSLNDQMAPIAEELADLVGYGGQLSDADRVRYEALRCEYTELQIQALEAGCFDYGYTPQQVQQAKEQYEAQLEECY